MEQRRNVNPEPLELICPTLVIMIQRRRQAFLDFVMMCSIVQSQKMYVQLGIRAPLDLVIVSNFINLNLTL